VGTLDVFRQTNQFLYHCTKNATVVPGMTATNLVVYKTSFGGSGTGVQPVADASINTNTTFMNIATLNTTTQCTGPTLVPAVPAVAPDTIGLPAYNTWNCNQPRVSNTVEIGFSDVEPVQFGSTPAQIARLDVAPTNVLMFGAPVTTGLRNALQDAQIVAGELAATCDDTAAARETLACMPSLTKSQISALYSGTVDSGTWSSLGVTNPTDDAIYVVRRVQTSGTQTSARIHFLNDPCTGNVVPFAVGNNGEANNSTVPCSTTPQAGNVYEGSGSQNVVACMNNHDVAGRWAIGVLSLEFAPGAADRYRHVKIDGVAPTVLEVARNRYHNWMEATMQWRNGTTVPNGNPDSGPLAGDDVALKDAFVNGLGDPVVIASINDSFAHAFCGGTVGCSGLLGTVAASVGAGLFLTPPINNLATVAARPVATATKSPLGAPNNCQFPVTILPH
jgi:hypothetical protein